MTNLARITFVPRHVAENLNSKNRALISIHDPEDPPLLPVFPWQHRLVLNFHDVDVAQDSRQLFTDEQAQSILRFAEEVAPLVGEIIVHCLLGLSRSAAVAVFLSEKHQVSLLKEDLPLRQGYALYNRFVYRRLYEAEYGQFGSAFETGVSLV